MESILNFCYEHCLLSIIAIATVALLTLWFVVNPRGNCKECHQLTRDTDYDDNHCCTSCFEILNERENKKLLAVDPKVSCPQDGHQMIKKMILGEYEKVIVNQCPHCKATFFKAGELEKIKEAIENETIIGDDLEFQSY